MQDIHPIKPIIETPVFTEFQVLFFWGVLALVLGGGSFFIGLQIRKKYRDYISTKKIIEPDKPRERDHKKEALDQLKKIKPMIDQQAFKEFYLAVTEVVKDYLTYKYQVTIVKMTTKEIKKLKPIPKTLKVQLQDFLSRVDEAKFAKAHQREEVALFVLELAKSLIR